MIRKNSQYLSFFGWFCPQLWDAALSIVEEVGGDPQKQHEEEQRSSEHDQETSEDTASTQEPEITDGSSEESSSSSTTQEGEAVSQSQKPETENTEQPEQDIARAEVSSSKQEPEQPAATVTDSKVSSENTDEAVAAAVAEAVEEKTQAAPKEPVLEDALEFEDETEFKQKQQDEKHKDEDLPPVNDADLQAHQERKTIPFDNGDIGYQATPGRSRLLVLLLAIAAALLLGVGFMLGKTTQTPPDVRQIEDIPPTPDTKNEFTILPEESKNNTQKESEVSGTVTPEAPITTPEPVEMTPNSTPTPSDTVTRALTPPSPAMPTVPTPSQEEDRNAMMDNAQTGEMGMGESGESPAAEIESRLSPSDTPAETPDNAAVPAENESAPNVAASAPDMGGMSMDMEAGAQMMEDNAPEVPQAQSEETTQAAQSESTVATSKSASTPVNAPQTVAKKHKVPEWVLPIWRAPLDDARPILPDYRIDGRQQIFPGNAVTAWLARTGESGVSLGDLAAYLALPGDVIPAQQGSISFSFSPVAGLADRYALSGTTGKPVLAGYLLDSAKFDAGSNGAFRLVLNPVQRVIAFAVRRPGGITEARWNYPAGFFANPQTWHTFVVSWGVEGLGLMVDGLEVAHRAGPIRIVARGPWFLGHGRPFGADGPRSMMGRYKDVAVYNDPYPLGAPK